MLFRSKVDKDTGEIEDKKYREKETDSKDFWMPILKQKSFRDYVESKYRVAATEILGDDASAAFDIETINGAK